MNYKPHKACDAIISKVKYPIYAMPKIDGVRACFFNKEFTTRTLKPFRNMHLNSLYDIPELEGFDGELAVGDIVDGDTCRRTTSFVNSYSYNSDPLNIPRWYLFDYITEDNLPYGRRINNLTERLKTLELPDNIRNKIEIIKRIIINSDEDLLAYHKQMIELGYEGTILRSLHGLHKNGRCTATEGNYLRIKDNADEEAVIIGLIEAKENNNMAGINELGYKFRTSHKENKVGKGMIGSLSVIIPDGRTIIISAGSMPHDERVHYWENQETLIGKTCTYRYMTYGEKDLRRHPRYKNLRRGDI